MRTSEEFRGTVLGFRGTVVKNEAATFEMIVKFGIGKGKNDVRKDESWKMWRKDE